MSECYYSKSTKGFYNSGNSGIPEDAVGLTFAQRDALLQGEWNGSVITSDANGFPILVSRILTKQEINSRLKAQLDTIDQLKIRAITDALISGDKTRLNDLEFQAGILRSQWIK